MSGRDEMKDRSEMIATGGNGCNVPTLFTCRESFRTFPVLYLHALRTFLSSSPPSVLVTFPILGSAYSLLVIFQSIRTSDHCILCDTLVRCPDTFKITSTYSLLLSSAHYLLELALILVSAYCLALILGVNRKP
ncbi:hypothetical protein BDZ91DRAFT_501682 [Kalaharituber pfeilii]|nr:hypothetical protein BDZ91DRAFT_501682 [Kalaharituber pfeilii]